jgi:two-component system, LytTR family, sensor kinase
MLGLQNNSNMKKLIVLTVFSFFLLNCYNQGKTKANDLLPTINQSVDIGYFIDFSASDLQIKRLTAVLDKDLVVFTLIYHSQKDRFLSFFTPPDGDVLEYVDWNGIHKNDSIITFKIAKNDFQSVDNITMRFSTNKNAESDRNFIFLNISEPTVRKLLGITNQHNVFSKIFTYYSSLMIFIALWLLIPILLFIGNKADSYTSVIERWITNKWLQFNVKVFIFSITIVLIVLSFSSYYHKPLHLNGYLYLLFIPVFPANLVYFIENTFFKSRKLFWLSQYLNLIFMIIGLYIIYKLFNEISGKIIAREIISLYYVIIWGILVCFVRLINNYISYQKIASLKEKELEILRLKELKVRSDLNALQSKINPHFLYNVLNSIAELCWEDPQKTERMALSLSKLFRYSINKEENDFNLLKNEIEIVRIYLSIEKERFGDKLNYQFDYGSDIENMLIPKFTLQPLIENAIKHGIAKKPNGGTIKLTIKKMENLLEIKVYDNGPEFPVNLISGYGLQSIYDKLDILFPNRYSIELYNGIEKNITVILKDGI